MSAKLTPARSRALEVLAEAEAERRVVRVSNQTNAANVYWQSARWLVEHGLANLVAYEYLELTQAGRDIAKAAL